MHYPMLFLLFLTAGSSRTTRVKVTIIAQCQRQYDCPVSKVLLLSSFFLFFCFCFRDKFCSNPLVKTPRVKVLPYTAALLRLDAIRTKLILAPEDSDLLWSHLFPQIVASHPIFPPEFPGSR